MIAVDTNVLVRLLTQDDEQQYNKSLKLFQEQAIFIADTVILETEWVLSFAYQFKPDENCRALSKLFGLPNVQLENASLMAQVLQWHEQGLNFADAFHLAKSQSCSTLYTFDNNFVKKAKDLTDCAVQQP